MNRQKNFKKLEESKLISGYVLCMACSLKKDLLATGTTNGEVILNRAGGTWHKVWTLAPITDKAKPRSIAFRPDSKVLAVGYDVGKLLLCTIEKCSVIHTHELAGDLMAVSYLSWVDVVASDNTGCSTLPPVYDFQYVDCQNVFLPKLPPNPSKSTGLLDNTKKDDYVEDAKGLKGQEQVLNLLLVATNTGHLAVYGYGLLKLFSLSLGSDHPIHNVCMSPHMDLLSVLTLNVDTGILSSHVIDTAALQQQFQNLRILSFQYGYCLYLLEYLESTLKIMLEQWEDGLSMLERHLTKVAIEIRESDTGPGSGSGVRTVSDELLNLLVFGECGEQLLMCLQHSVTDRVVKKLGSNTESSYNNLLKLILRYLMLVSHALFYRCSDLKALCKLPEGIVLAGVDMECVVKAQSTLAAFMMKTTELHEVIEKSLKIFKAFFKFLNTWSLRLSNEPVPPEISSMSEEEIWSVTEFLREHASKERMFNVEQMRKKNLSFDRVRQYLRNANLKYPEKLPEHEWSKLKVKLLEKQTEQLFYPDYPNKSLIQLHREFVKDIDAIYALPHNKLTNIMVTKQTEAIAVPADRVNIPANLRSSDGRDKTHGSSVAAASAGKNSPQASSAKGVVENSVNMEFVADQCILQGYLYTVVISKTRSKQNSMLVLKQCAGEGSNKLWAVKLLCSAAPADDSAAAQSRFEDVNFFTHNQQHSLCILLSESDNVDLAAGASNDGVRGEGSVNEAVNEMVVDIENKVEESNMADTAENAAASPPASDEAKLQENETFNAAECFAPYLMMLPLSAFISYMSEVTVGKDISDLLNENSDVPTVSTHGLCGVRTKKLENMLASQIIVNSDRNVICVLYSFRRRFRIFEFGDIEDNEGDENDPSLTDTSNRIDVI